MGDRHKWTVRIKLFALASKVQPDDTSMLTQTTTCLTTPTTGRMQPPFRPNVDTGQVD
jgi:hypothetical protein